MNNKLHSRFIIYKINVKIIIKNMIDINIKISYNV